MTADDLRSLVEKLCPVARLAGQRIMEIHAGSVRAKTKSDGSPVTEADAAAEEVILAALQRLAPDIPVVSEENPDSHGQSGLRTFFLVDPLDGTREFLKPDGGGAFTVNIALIENARPTLGVVFAPALDRMFNGIVADGALEERDGCTHRLAVRDPDRWRVALASASHRDAETDAWLNEHEIEETIAVGSSLKFCLLAAGEADVYPRFGPTKEWDTAAGDAILRAAGGSMCQPDGSPFLYGKPCYQNGAFIAAGGRSLCVQH